MKPYLCYTDIVRFGEVRKLIGDNSLNEVYCVTELKLMIHSHFIEILMILTVFNVSVWLTEYSVTVGSVTVRFYYIIFQAI